MNAAKEYIEGVSKLMGGNRREWFYNSVFDFLLKEGIEFKSEALTEAEKTAVHNMLTDFTQMHGKPQYKQCFYNAQMARLEDGMNIFEYAEGYAVDEKIGVPLHHGFLTINNKVVDITWRDDDGNFYIGEKAGGYFGVQINKEDLRSIMIETGMVCPHLEAYQNGGEIFKQKFINGEQYLHKKGQNSEK